MLVLKLVSLLCLVLVHSEMSNSENVTSPQIAKPKSKNDHERTVMGHIKTQESANFKDKTISKMTKDSIPMQKIQSNRHQRHILYEKRKQIGKGDFKISPDMPNPKRKIHLKKIDVLKQVNKNVDGPIVNKNDKHEEDDVEIADKTGTDKMASKEGYSELKINNLGLYKRKDQVITKMKQNINKDKECLNAQKRSKHSEDICMEEENTDEKGAAAKMAPRLSNDIYAPKDNLKLRKEIDDIQTVTNEKKNFEISKENINLKKNVKKILKNDLSNIDETKKENHKYDNKETIPKEQTKIPDEPSMRNNPEAEDNRKRNEDISKADDFKPNVEKESQSQIDDSPKEIEELKEIEEIPIEPSNQNVDLEHAKRVVFWLNDVKERLDTKLDEAYERVQEMKRKMARITEKMNALNQQLLQNFENRANFHSSVCQELLKTNLSSIKESGSQIKEEL